MLAERFEVDLVTADDANPAPAEYADRFHSISAFERPRGLAARARRAVSALRPSASLHTSGSVTRALRTHVAQAARARAYRAVIFDLNMVEAVPRGVPQIYHAHNCETLLLRRRVPVEPIPARAIVALDAIRLAPIESRVLREAELTVACSQADLDDLAGLVPGTALPSVIVPNGVDVSRYEAVYRTPRPERIALITGRYDWRPNQLGLDWFCTAVLPELRRIAAERSFEIRVAGRMSDAFVRKISAIVPLVAVPNPVDMRGELARASVVVAPIVASSGTRLRILEAWAAGRPVVTTPEGAFGLEFTADRDLLVRERGDPEGFARALWGALDDRESADRIARAGFARALEYDWSSLRSGLGDAVARAIEIPQPGMR